MLGRGVGRVAEHARVGEYVHPSPRNRAGRSRGRPCSRATARSMFTSSGRRASIIEVSHSPAVQPALSGGHAELGAEAERRLHQQREVGDRRSTFTPSSGPSFSSAPPAARSCRRASAARRCGEAVPRPAAHEVADDALEGLLLDRHRAREREVVARAADPHGRRAERVEALGDRARELVAEDRVGAQRQVVAVLLDRPEGDHDRVAAAARSPARTSGQVRVSSSSAPMTRHISGIYQKPRSCALSTGCVVGWALPPGGSERDHHLRRVVEPVGNARRAGAVACRPGRASTGTGLPSCTSHTS